MVVFDQSGCLQAIVVVFGQKWLYCGQSGCMLAKWLYLGKSSCIRAKWLYLGKSGCIQAKWLYLGVVELGQKWLCSK